MWAASAGMKILICSQIDVLTPQEIHHTSQDLGPPHTPQTNIVHVRGAWNTRKTPHGGALLLFARFFVQRAIAKAPPLPIEVAVEDLVGESDV